MSLGNLAKLINAANEKKSPEKVFMDAYNSTLIALDEPRKPSKFYKPSSIGGCPRNVYFQRIGTEQDKNSGVSPEIMEMGHSGTDRHERIQKVVMNMRKHGFDIDWIPLDKFLESRPVEGTKVVSKVGAEYKLFNEKYQLSLMCDGVIKLESVYYILEIKTEVSFKWQGRCEVSVTHIPQACSYALVLGIPRILFLYENRDMLKKKPFVIEVTPKQIQETVLDPIIFIEKHIMDGVIPDKTDSPNLCKYCRYTEECKKW